MVFAIHSFGTKANWRPTGGGRNSYDFCTARTRNRVLRVIVLVYARICMLWRCMDTELPTSRRAQIEARLAKGQTVVATVLAAEFGVSEDAIRRDLRARCRRPVPSSVWRRDAALHSDGADGGAGTRGIGTKT